MIPEWLHILSLVSLLTGFVGAGVAALDLWWHPQKMWIMNVVWPVVALFAPFVGLWAYYCYGRRKAVDAPENAPETPFPVAVGKGASHCGAGCTLGDICAEWLAFFFPAIAVTFGWQQWFGEKIFAVWIFDYLLAFGFGVAFQYFTIKPMRGLSPGRGLVEAVKADFLSLTAWQVGMYGFMALAHFYFFRQVLGTELHVNSLEFWFMMQIAMWAGFATSYPVNWWLIKAGIKEKM